MYKKSFFRGLGTGLIVGALTVTVAFNFDNAGKNNSDQGNTTKVVQQDNTENTGSTSETAKTTETEKNTTEKSTGKDNTKDAAKDSTKDTTEKVSSDTKGSNINGKGDVNSGGSNGKSTETAATQEMAMRAARLARMIRVVHRQGTSLERRLVIRVDLHLVTIMDRHRGAMI